MFLRLLIFLKSIEFVLCASSFSRGAHLADGATNCSFALCATKFVSIISSELREFTLVADMLRLLEGWSPFAESDAVLLELLLRSGCGGAWFLLITRKSSLSIGVGFFLLGCGSRFRGFSDTSSNLVPVELRLSASVLLKLLLLLDFLDVLYLTGTDFYLCAGVLLV